QAARPMLRPPERRRRPVVGAHQRAELATAVEERTHLGTANDMRARALSEVGRTTTSCRKPTTGCPDSSGFLAEPALGALHLDEAARVGHAIGARTVERDLEELRRDERVGQRLVPILGDDAEARGPLVEAAAFLAGKERRQ